MLAQVAPRAGLMVHAVGSPDATLASAVAQRWEASTGLQPRVLDDLRAAIATTQRGGLVLIASPGAFGAAASLKDHDRVATRLDVEEIDSAQARGVKIVSLEPFPASLAQLSRAGVRADALPQGAPRTGGHWAEFAPLSRATRPVAELRELLPALGPVRSIAVQALGAPAHGSLGARLFDAADLVLALLGQPESVHAVCTTPVAVRGAHAGPPAADHLRGLTGDISISMRFDGNRAGTLLASNQAGDADLAVTVLAQNGRATIRRGTLAWISADGGSTDQPVVRPARALAAGWKAEPDDQASFTAILARQTRAFAESGVGLTEQVDVASTLAFAQAALLSARTGEPESPATMLRLAGL